VNKIVIGHPEAHEKLTAKLFWKLSGASGYNDAGNVKDYNDASTRSLVTRPESKTGARFVNDEQADVNHESYTFLLDERVPEQEKLIKLAAALADQKQKDTEGATATVESVQPGRWFDFGVFNVANLSVNASKSGPQSEGDDYDVDLPNGRIYIVSGGGISAGEDLNLTFDQPGVDLGRVQTQKSPLFYCDILIEEHNQYHKVWLRRLEFKGYLNVTEFPAQTGEFGTYRVKATPAGPVTVEKRPEGQSLGAQAIVQGVAGESSSSQSLSSSSSSSSRSSKSSASSQSSSSTDISTSASSYSSSSTSAASYTSSSSSESTAAEESSASSQSSSSSSSTEVSTSATSYSSESMESGSLGP
jgi:hypothetical protein